MIKEKDKILKAPLGEEEKEKKKRVREEEKRKKKEDAEEEEGIICEDKQVSLLFLLKANFFDKNIYMDCNPKLKRQKDWVF